MTRTTFLQGIGKLGGTLAIVATATIATAAPAPTVVGFDDGSDGGFIGNAFFVGEGGNPDGQALFLVAAFFPELRSGGLGEPANPDLLGDYSPLGEVTLGFDVKVNSITDFIGNPISRSIGISLIDRDIQGINGSSGVFFELAVLSEFVQVDWTTLSVTIEDTTASELPPGWIGFGDEDPETFEPRLPPGATFATVLAGVDEFQITGAVPGFFFQDANFDFQLDNVTLSTPGVEPGLAGTLSGVEARLATCRNLTDPQFVSTPLPEISLEASWDCDALGLGSASGERVRLTARGVNFTPIFVGSVAGLQEGATAVCRNITQDLTAVTGVTSEGTWDCAAAGLPFVNGDVVVTIVEGTVE